MNSNSLLQGNLDLAIIEACIPLVQYYEQEAFKFIDEPELHKIVQDAIKSMQWYKRSGLLISVKPQTYNKHLDNIKALFNSLNRLWW